MLTLNQLCRTCLIPNDCLLPIFEINLTDAENPLTIADLLQSFTSTKILEGDGFPQHVCVNCLKQIKLIYEFKIKCQRAEAFLIQLIREAKARFAMNSTQTQSSQKIPVIIPAVGTIWIQNPNNVPNITSALRMNNKQSVSSLINSSIDSNVLAGKIPAAMSVGSTTIIPINSAERVIASNSKKVPINPPEVLLQASKPNQTLQAEPSSYDGVPVIPLSRILKEVKFCESALKDPALSVMQNSSAKLFKVQLDQDKIKTIAAIRESSAHSKVTGPGSAAPPPSSEHDYASRGPTVTVPEEAKTMKMSENNCERSPGNTSILFDSEANNSRKTDGMQTDLGSSLRSIVASMGVAASQKTTTMKETTATQKILNSDGSSGTIVINNIAQSLENRAISYINQPIPHSATKSTIVSTSVRPFFSSSTLNSSSAVPTLTNKDDNQKFCTDTTNPLQGSKPRTGPSLKLEIASIAPDVNLSSSPMLLRILNSTPSNVMKTVPHASTKATSIPLREKEEMNIERMSKITRNCPGCNEQFTDAAIMLKHIVAEHTEGSYCLLCNSKGILTMTKHCELHLPAVYFCADCNKGYPFRRKLREHLESASESKHFCAICDACFCVRADYQRHLRKHEIEYSKSGEIFVCCSQEFLSENEYKSHMIKSHDKNETFKCDVCSKTFPNQKRLKVHKRSDHNRSKDSLKCPICPRLLTGESALKSHILAHEKLKKDDINRRRCEICFAIFDKAQQMRRHQKVHTTSGPFKCPLCDRSCSSGQSLKAHINTFHSTVRPYRCNLCRVAFKMKNNLHVHLLGEMHKKNKAEQEAGKSAETDVISNQAQTVDVES